MSSSHHKQLVSGVAYTAVAKYSGQLVQLVITAILSRMLAPEAFGTILCCTVVINLFAIFTEMGLGPAVIQYKDLTKSDLNNFFSFTCWVGLALSILFFFSAPLVAAYFEDPILIPLSRILSLHLLFSSMTTVPNNLMYKNKEFKFIAIRTLSIQVVTGAAAIAASYMLSPDTKIYALVMQTIGTSMLVFVVTYLRYPLKLRLRLGLSSIRKVFKYSAYQGMFMLINYFSRNLDKIFIGRYIGLSAAGYYEKSYRTMLLPLQNITSVISPVIHPIFSEMQNDLRSMHTGYMKIVKLLAFIGFPISVLLVFGGREIILLIFGMQWIPSVKTFEILALSVGFQVILSSSGSIFQAAGDTRSLFVTGLVNTIINVVGIIISITIFQTIEAVATGIVITFTINFFICYGIMSRRTFRMPMGEFLRQLLSPLLVTGLLVAALLPLYLLLPEDMNMFLSLGIKCAAAAAIYLPYIQYTGALDIIGKTRAILNRKK